MKREEATRIIALTLAEMRSRPFEPMASEWSDATFLAHKFEKEGYIKPEVEQEELTVYGHAMIGPTGNVITTFDGPNSQQQAIDLAALWTEDAKKTELDGMEYTVAAIVDQGGL